MSTPLFPTRALSFATCAGILLLAACADQPDHLVAPDGINADLQATSDGINADLQATSETVWFVTDPPEPALVGETYEVEVGATGEGNILEGVSLKLESLTPFVCSLADMGGDAVTSRSGTATFLAAGDCTMRASDGITEAYQIFTVYEPSDTPAPIMKTCTKTHNSKTISMEIPLDRDCPTGWD